MLEFEKYLFGLESVVAEKQNHLGDFCCFGVFCVLHFWDLNRSLWALVSVLFESFTSDPDVHLSLESSFKIYRYLLLRF